MSSQSVLETPHLVLEAERQGPVTFRLAGGEAVLVSERCPDGTDPNEDAAALIPIDDTCAVIAIADGAGGAPLGNTAARLAVEALANAVRELEGASPRERILDGFDRANTAVLDLGVGAATTLAVAEIGPSGMRAYHAGDSAIAVAGQRGRIKLVTLMHSPTGYAVEAGLLDENEALMHEQRNVVSNLVGAANMRVEVGSVLELARYDTLILGSDGLFDNLQLPEIVEQIRTGPLEAAAEQLAAACRDRMRGTNATAPSKPDDLTFVLFRGLPRA